MEMSKETTANLEKAVTSIQSGLESASGIGIAAAAVSATLTIGPAGAHLQGWITYLDGKYGKIHFKSKKVHDKSGLFAGAFAFPAWPTLLPDSILGKPGRTKVTGSASSGVVSLFAGGNLIGAFPVGGAGTPWPFGWSLDAVVDYTKG